MSSDMFMFDEPYYPNLATTNLLSSDDISANFFTDPISALSDSSIDTIFQEFSDDQNTNTNNNFTTNSSLTTTTTTNTTQISADEVQSLDQIAHTLFSNSPPSHQLETLSIHQQQQQSQMGSLGNVLTNNNNNNNNNNNDNNNNNYSVVSDSSVKTEDFHMGFDYPHGSYNSYFINNNNNYDATTNETMLKFMQRSYSSNSFDGKPSFWFQPKFNSLFEVQTFQPEIESSSFTNGQMRRVSSTGDLPMVGRVCSSSASPLSGGGEGNNMEESNFKVGKYSAEERKERIDRYRAKRTQRNFNKTIKYACRKTLADNRPRIRGRFARNDETGEIPKPTCFNRYEDDDDLWVDNLQEEDEEGILGRRGGGRYLSNFGATHHFQYCGY